MAKLLSMKSQQSRPNYDHEVRDTVLMIMTHFHRESKIRNPEAERFVRNIIPPAAPHSPDQTLTFTVKVEQSKEFL